VDAETLQRASTATQIDGKAVPLAVGLPASPGIGTGVLSCDPDEAAALAQTGTPVVLAREYTSPSDVHGMVGAAAVVTTTGGVASHAAVVARGWGIPCATGMTKAVVSPSGVQIGAVTIRCGQLVTVDGSTGALYEGDCRAPETRVADEARILRTWASELGVEPGSGAPRNAAPSGDREVTLLEVLRTVQLKGLCSTERAAAALGVTVDSVANHITAANSLFRETARGFMVSPEGREWVEEGLQREGDGSDSRLLNAEYEQFSVLNARFKQLVHAWQDATAGGDDASHSALLDSLQSIHQELTRTLTTIASAAPRLATYEQRFESALAALRGGDHSMLASPLKDSYHTVWFEYHEELVRLCRRDRLAEERGGN
jgi:pyruvate,orthophosphate dikinase